MDSCTSTWLVDVLEMFYPYDMASRSNTQQKARGARSNATGRFEAHSRETVDDGWGGDTDHDAPVVTEVREEMARRIITYNRSPDLPFDRSLNPYRGCEHGCIYCFARPTHAYLGLSPGLDFETRLVARPNAAERLRREISADGYRVATLAMGTNTDPYQPIERDRRITRTCLEVLAEANHPVALVTKGTLVERDIDILSEMGRQKLARVGISVTTLDENLARRMEPRAPTPKRRLQTISRLVQKGIEVRVMASPMVPAMTDHELEAILKAGAEAGATSASWIMLRLPLEVSKLWQEWLEIHAPDRAARIMARLREMHGGKEYDARWGHRMRGEGEYAEMVQKRFRLALKRTGLSEKAEPLRRDLFRPPALDGRQMSLL